MVRRGARVDVFSVDMRTDQPASAPGLIDADEAARRLDRLFDASADGIVVASTEGVYLRLNPAACAIYGRPAEEIVGVPIGLVEGSERIDPDTWAALLRGDGAEHHVRI